MVFMPPIVGDNNRKKKIRKISVNNEEFLQKIRNKPESSRCAELYIVVL